MSKPTAASVLRRVLKRVPLFVWAHRLMEQTKHRVYWDAKLSRWQRLLKRRDIDILQQLSLYVPRSEGACRPIADLTLWTAQEVFPLLARLCEDTRTESPMTVRRVQDLIRDAEDMRLAEELGSLFRKWGSDKSTRHNYHLWYAPLLSPREHVRAILEVGLGTNNPNMVSTMGVEGRPGASLRAFRDFCPESRVYGADVDREILFQEERIITCFVDQTNPASLDELEKVAKGPFDLVIDDGLHCPSANLSVLLYGLRRLRPGGWLVVEDVARDAEPFWRVVAELLPSDFTCCFVLAQGGQLFGVQRAAAVSAPRA